MRSSNEAGSFWGVLARKAKAILDDDNIFPQSNNLDITRPEMLDSSRGDQVKILLHSLLWIIVYNVGNHGAQHFQFLLFLSFLLYFHVGISEKMDNPTLRKGLDAFTSSLNNIGGTIGNALEVNSIIYCWIRIDKFHIPVNPVPPQSKIPSNFCFFFDVRPPSVILHYSMVCVNMWESN